VGKPALRDSPCSEKKISLTRNRSEPEVSDTEEDMVTAQPEMGSRKTSVTTQFYQTP
jgi:hypothetical protein